MSHEALKQQISLFDNQVIDDNEAHVDISFLHRSFCAAGLPLRNPKKLHFARPDGEFSLNINGKTIVTPTGRQCEIGVPFGAPARLLMVWAATEVQKQTGPNDRWLEIGPIKAWMRTVGLKDHGKNFFNVREQLVRLSFASFTMVGKAGGHSLFRNDQLVEGGIFQDDDLDLYADGKAHSMRWPTAIQLSERAFTRFAQEGIPIPTQRLAQISHSAMAIDVFLFMCYRLPMIPLGESERITWKSLIAQFGSKEPPSKFRDTFTTSIRAALDAYPEAKIDLTEEGLLMHYSDPAELRRAFVSLQPAGKPKSRRVLRKRFDPRAEGRARA